MDENSEIRDIFIVGLRNAHAMENQALSIMRPQVKRIENYPEVAARLEEHIRETEGQMERLERLLESFGESTSTLKDTALSVLGSLAAMGHVVAGDEIIKNSLANFAFENYEIAAYNVASVVERARTFCPGGGHAAPKPRRGSRHGGMAGPEPRYGDPPVRRVEGGWGNGKGLNFAMTEMASRRFPVTAGILLGLGLGGFFDGIVLHQILQWHHIATSAGYPADSVENLEFNTLLDGLFHAVTYIFVAAGVLLLWRGFATRQAIWSGKMLVGTVLMGFGIFNVVEGLADHHLLGLHHVNETVPREQWLLWDLAFLLWGLAMIVVGWRLFRGGRQPTLSNAR